MNEMVGGIEKKKQTMVAANVYVCSILFDFIAHWCHWISDVWIAIATNSEAIFVNPRND